MAFIKVSWLMMQNMSVGLILIGIAIVFSFVLTPHEMIVSPTDPSLQLPYIQNTVPMWSLYLTAVLSWIVMSGYIAIQGKWDEVFKLGTAWIGAIGIVEIITQLLKSVVGRPRPNFFANPNGRNARMSFPSGHTGFSFAIMHLMSLCLLDRFRSKTGHLSFVMMLLALSPHIFAGWVGITRIHDYHHHYLDVVAGALFGMMAARVAYSVNFPVTKPRSRASSQSIL